MGPPRPKPAPTATHRCPLATLSLSIYAILPDHRPIHMCTGNLASLVTGDPAEGCTDRLFVCLSSAPKPPPAAQLALLRDVLLREAPVPGYGVLPADCVPRGTRQLAEWHRELAGARAPGAIFATLRAAGGAGGACTGVLAAALMRLTELATTDARTWSDDEAETLHAAVLTVLTSQRRSIGAKEAAVLALSFFADGAPARCLYSTLPSAPALVPHVLRFARQGSAECMDACATWTARSTAEMIGAIKEAPAGFDAAVSAAFALSLVREEVEQLLSRHAYAGAGAADECPPEQWALVRALRMLRACVRLGGLASRGCDAREVQHALAAALALRGACATVLGAALEVVAATLSRGAHAAHAAHVTALEKAIFGGALLRHVARALAHGSGAQRAAAEVCKALTAGAHALLPGGALGLSKYAAADGVPAALELAAARLRQADGRDADADATAAALREVDVAADAMRAHLSAFPPPPTTMTPRPEVLPSGGGACSDAERARAKAAKKAGKKAGVRARRAAVAEGEGGGAVEEEEAA
jgi:hypothetical protein